MKTKSTFWNNIPDLYEQRRITAPKYYRSDGQWSSMQEYVFRVEQFPNMVETSDHGKTMFINNKSTILFTWNAKIIV